VSQKYDIALDTSEVRCYRLAMANKINQLLEVTQSLERLCLENEQLRLLIQETWPVAQKLSPLAALNQACKEHAAEFHSRSNIAATRPSSALSVPAPCEQILEGLETWIQQMRESTFDRVEKARGTL
jgi:hypothetical protein